MTVSKWLWRILNFPVSEELSRRQEYKEMASHKCLKSTSHIQKCVVAGATEKKKLVIYSPSPVLKTWLLCIVEASQVALLVRTRLPMQEM